MPPRDSQAVEQIIANVLLRRKRGEDLSDDEVIAETPELAEQLIPRLRQLNIIEQAQQIAERAPFDDTITHGQ